MAQSPGGEKCLKSCHVSGLSLFVGPEKRHKRPPTSPTPVVLTPTALCAVLEEGALWQAVFGCSAFPVVGKSDTKLQVPEERTSAQCPLCVNVTVTNYTLYVQRGAFVRESMCVCSVCVCACAVCVCVYVCACVRLVRM